MPSDLQVDNIKDGSATKTLAEYASSAWSWGTPPAGTTLQTLHFETTETNALTTSFVNYYENSIQLKSASSDVFVVFGGSYYLNSSSRFGVKIYRNNSATVTTSHTGVWTKNPNSGSASPITVYSSVGSAGPPVVIHAKDTVSGFSAGDTLYYGVFAQRSSDATVDFPQNDTEDGFFYMTLTEVQK